MTQWEQEDGYINRDEGTHSEGSVVAIYGKCDKCGHDWKFRCLQITDLVNNNEFYA